MTFPKKFDTISLVNFMKYNKVKDAKKIINQSSYLIKNPEDYKNKWSKLFGNNNKVCLELGSGRGKFLVGMAEKYKNINFIGVELFASQLTNAINLLEHKNLKNIVFINADAMNIDKMFGKEIDTIYLTFSEPWPKKKDIKKRFTSPIYLRLYDKIFKKKKHIILKTDNKILFAYSLEMLSQHWYEFKKVSLDLHNDESKIENVMTDFEANYFKENRKVFYLDAEFNG